MSTKKVTEYTDRELLEKVTMFAKTTANNTTFIKKLFDSDDSPVSHWSNRYNDSTLTNC